MSLKMGLLGRKIGMTQVFHDDGTALGVHRRRRRSLRRRRQADAGQARLLRRAAGLRGDAGRACSTRPASRLLQEGQHREAAAHLREVRLEPKDLEKYEVGKVLRASEVFKAGDVVDVVGTTKGKGYQGVMKKHRMAGDSGTHGTHEFFRHGGSIGCRLTPGRVHKGKRMSGLMGNVKNTASDLVVVKVLEDKDLVLVKGAIPGAGQRPGADQGQRQGRQEVHRPARRSKRSSRRTR